MVNRVPWLFEGFTLLLFIHQEHMNNLEYIHEQLCYAEDQRELADDMYSIQAWDQRIDALQCAYNFIADQGVSKEARESVPQVLTINYN